MSSVARETHASPDRCPWCDSVISRARFLDVQDRIAEQERARLEEEKARMRKELALREAAIRKDAEERAKAEAEKVFLAERAQFTSKIEDLEAGRELHQQELANLRATMETGLRDRLEGLTQEHQKDLEQVRSALAKDREEELRKVRSQQIREKDQLQKKIDALARQNLRKTSDELGDGAEVDVYEALRESFPYDKIHRIKKGLPGADIRHEVLHNGSVCGTILIDSKNRQAWQSSYVAKLRDDQITGKADNAILATTVFPSGARDLCIDADTQIIIVNPRHTAEIVGLLRSALIRAHTQGLSLTQRAEKQNLLYSYITSEEYRQHVAEAARLAGEVLDLDVDEKRAHDRTWERRGKMVTRLRNVVREIDTEVTAVLEGAIPRDFEN